MNRPDRRTFQLSLIYGLWAIMSAAFALPAAIYLLVPPKARKGTDWTDVGDLNRLPIGTPEEVVFRRNRVDGWKVTTEKNTAWVVRTSESEVIALAPQCTHLGCAYHWSERTKEFHCPCHTSSFSIEGIVLSGPAPRALDRYDIRVQNNKLLIGAIRKPEQA
jgi:menaquinol-cytochrome c reductase iron-sulfur subunit